MITNLNDPLERRLDLKVFKVERFFSTEICSFCKKEIRDFYKAEIQAYYITGERPVLTLCSECFDKYPRATASVA